MGTVAVGGIIEKEGKFLLMQEAQEACRGKWSIPAGLVDPGENIFESAVREIKEEAGYDVKLTGILEIGNRIDPEPFLGIIFSTELIKKNNYYDEEEVLDIKWYTYEELLNMKDELRSYDWIINSIKAYKENKIIDLDLIKLI